MMLNEKQRSQNPDAANGGSAVLTQTSLPHARISQLGNVLEFVRGSDHEEVTERLHLPALATANDVRELVQFLKQRPQGVNLCDLVQPLKKRVFYPAKIEAYLYWGLVTKNGDRLKLTSLGWEFAKSLEPEARAYQQLLGRTALYIAALRWISDQELDLVHREELLEFWESFLFEVNPAAAPLDGGRAVVSFFHLCQAAELGTLTIGKRGQPARLRVWREALFAFLNPSCTRHQPAECQPERAGIVISSASGNDDLDQVRRVLREAGFESELAGECEYGEPLNSEVVRVTICTRPTRRNFEKV